MATHTFYPADGNDDGCIINVHPNYATAVSGHSPSVRFSDTFDKIQCGQKKDGSNYWCYQGFFKFDTSSLGASFAVDSVTASFWILSDLSTTDFTMECRAYDWADPFSTSDWQDPDDWNVLTLLGSFSTVGLSTGDYKALTGNDDFKAHVQTTGDTSFLLCSDRFGSETQPTTVENLIIQQSENSGTTQDPKLVVTGEFAVQPPVKSFGLLGQAPAIEAGTIEVPNKSFSVVGQTPGVTSGASAAVPVKAVARAGQVPAVATGASVASPAQSFSRQNHAPAVETGVGVAAPVRAYSHAGLVLGVATGISLAAPSKGFAFSGMGPGAGTGMTVATPAKAFLLAGVSPSVLARAWIVDQEKSDTWARVSAAAESWTRL